MPAKGDTIYVFNPNRRVYPKENERAWCVGPIYREHFQPHLIVSETKQSWVLDDKRKVSKATHRVNNGRYASEIVALSFTELNDLCWVHDHKHVISDAVRDCPDVSVLRTIAALLGMKDA